MKQTKREKVSMYSAEDFFSGKKDAKPVGWMSNPDDFGPVLVDRETLFRLMAEAKSKKGKGMKAMKKEDIEQPTIMVCVSKTWGKNIRSEVTGK